MTPKQIKEFRQKACPGKHSMQLWCKICGVPRTTINNYELGINRIPKLYAKFIELWDEKEPVNDLIDAVEDYVRNEDDPPSIFESCLEKIKSRKH